MGNKELHCTGCDNKLEFGGASRGMVAAMGGMKAVMQTMAEQCGWRKIAGVWKCGYCLGTRSDG